MLIQQSTQPLLSIQVKIEYIQFNQRNLHKFKIQNYRKIRRYQFEIDTIVNIFLEVQKNQNEKKLQMKSIWHQFKKQKIILITKRIKLGVQLKRRRFISLRQQKQETAESLIALWDVKIFKLIGQMGFQTLISVNKLP
ncbi:unnamed protein product [Paramecium pentaurelia]|uniref:Uncharacterized protein n=1 Tax=Paramecium pentaurelia TaxID=43138 RepID=A0A8S1TA37_9CILI|nr:unnamed protein product [Paramecium pentaurelia]